MSAKVGFFARIGNLIKHEPAVLLSAVGAGVGFAADMGLHVTVDQQRSIYAAVAMVTGFFIRQTVTPSSEVSTRLDALEGALAGLNMPAVTSVVSAAAAAADGKPVEPPVEVSNPAPVPAPAISDPGPTHGP